MPRFQPWRSARRPIAVGGGTRARGCRMPASTGNKTPTRMVQRTQRRMPRPSQPIFIDLFAGCGGFSLGFCKAGWRGLFAIEQNKDAFDTFSRNLLSEESPFAFDWPTWLPKRHHGVGAVLKRYRRNLRSLR